MKRPKVIWISILAIVALSAILWIAARRRFTDGLFAALSPYIYRHRSVMYKDPISTPSVVEVFHLKGIEPLQAEHLIKDKLIAAGFSKASAPANPSIVYDHRTGANDVLEVEIFSAKQYATEGTLVVWYRPVDTEDLVIGRITHLGRDPLEKTEVLTDSPIHFLGER